MRLRIAAVPEILTFFLFFPPCGIYDFLWFIPNGCLISVSFQLFVVSFQIFLSECKISFKLTILVKRFVFTFGFDLHVLLSLFKCIAIVCFLLMILVQTILSVSLANVSCSPCCST